MPVGRRKERVDEAESKTSIDVAESPTLLWIDMKKGSMMTD